MNCNTRQSEALEGHDFLNVEGNMEARLLGRNLDDSTPLLQHDDFCTRVRTRRVYAIKQAIMENIGGLLVALAVLCGLALTVAAVTTKEFHPMLVTAAAMMFILSAITFKITRA